MRLIDADELKEFVKEKCSYCTSFIGEESVLSWIDKAPTIEEVDELNLPSVSAERVGEWIETAEQYYVAINEKGGGVDENTPYFLDEDIACSECFAIFNVFDNETDKFNFCPNCGAKMKEE